MAGPTCNRPVNATWKGLNTDERAVFSFAHVREGKRSTGLRRFYTNLVDAALYFGPKAIVQKNY